jgi:predicted nucleotidyltransferase
MKPLSKNRAELLRLFMTNPDQSFYMQEIGRLFNKKPGVFQRTINNMHEEGILSSEYKANARYFKANKSYPLFDEFKSIVFKTVGAKGLLQEMLKKLDGIKTAFIYGSFAKDQTSAKSDIDLFIIGNTDEDKLIGGIRKLENILRREINYCLYTREDWQKKKRQKNTFIMDILANPRIFLAGGKDDL